MFWLNASEALQRLHTAAARLLRERPDVLEVRLFGSLAEGRAVPGSDADVLVLLRASERRWMDRPLEFAPYFEGVGLPVDLFCYTREEAERTPLARGALQGGVPLGAG